MPGWLAGGGGGREPERGYEQSGYVRAMVSRRVVGRVEKPCFRVADGGGVSRLTFTQSSYGNLNRSVGRHQLRKQSVNVAEPQRLGHFPVAEIGSRIFKFYQSYFQLANRHRPLHNSIPRPKNHTSAYCKMRLTRSSSDVIAHIELCTANSRRTKTTVCTASKKSRSERNHRLHPAIFS